jgi:hypothetical protein
VIPNLLYDICRCHDTGCPERETCLRFLRRDDLGWRVASAATFREADGKCNNKIPYDPKRSEHVRKG